MKKLMMIAAVAATMISPAETNSVDSVREKAMITIADYESSYVTNGFWRSTLGIGYYAITNLCSRDPDFRAYAVSVFTNKPYFGMLAARGKAISPVVHEAAIDRMSLDLPVFASILKRGGIRKVSKALSSADRVAYMLERTAFLAGGKLPKEWVDHVVAAVLSHCSREVRAKLRSEGLPIAGDQATAIVKARLDAVSAALESPAFSGLSVAMGRCGIDVNVPQFDGFSGFDVQKLHDRIYSGYVRFGDIEQGTLRFWLGLEEYNKFVDRYNSGDQK